MKVISSLIFLGFAYELVWFNIDLNPRVTLFKLKYSLNTPKAGKVAGLFCNSAGTALYVLPYKNVGIENIENTNGRAGALSASWAGYESDILLRLSLPNRAAVLKKIGQLEKIEYTSDKLDRAGDRKGHFSLYTHKYKRPLDLYADRAQNPRVFGAKLGAKKIVTSRGLIG